MIPRVFHHIWVGGVIPETFALWRQRLIELHPNFDFKLWNEENIPSLGLDLKALLSDYIGPAGASNVVRLKAVLDFGGIYVDLDVEPILPLNDLFDNEAFAARQDGDRLCNAFFGARPDHPWIRWQYQRYHFSRGVPAYWGVELMSDAPREGVTIIPSEWCYPYLWDAPPECRVPHPTSKVVHRWDGSWGK